MLFRKIAAGVVAALALLLTACGGPIQGVVTGKDYRGPYTTILPAGKVFVPIQHPECWRLELNSGRTTCVPRERWDSISIGDFYKEERQ